MMNHLFNPPWPETSWFTRMALKHLGRVYKNSRWDAYFFYRKVYEMTASEALAEVNKWSRQ